MVVDDNPAILEMVSTFLTVIGDAKVSTYNSGTEALAAFSAAPEAFDMVITDLEMPCMNGLELIHHLRAKTRELKIVLMTGNHLGIEKALAEENGLSGFLYKPFGLDSLRELLEQVGSINSFKATEPCAR